MSSSGGNFFGKALDTVTSAVSIGAFRFSNGRFQDGQNKNFVVSNATDELTFGTKKYKDGKWVNGKGLNAVSEGWGEVSGRNFKRQQLNIEGDKVNAAEDAARQSAIDELNRKKSIDTQSSYAASASTLNKASLSPMLARPLVLGNPEKDFLGL